MKSAFFTTTVTLSLLLCTHADEVAKPASDYFISEPDLALNIKILRQPYTIEINRNSADAQAEALLKKAEALYPKREKVLAIMSQYERATPPVSGAKEPLWWSDSANGVRIPYAITAGAVVYYQNLIQEFMQGDFKGSRNTKMYRASLKYTANIKKYKDWTYQKQTFKDVYVADLVLTWRQSCGGRCAMGFETKRQVVLDKAGNVRAVFGDGRTGVVIS